MRTPVIRLSNSARRALQEAAVDAGGDPLRIRPPPQNLWVIEPVGGGVLGFVLWEENTPTTRGGSCAKPSAVLQRPVGAFWASTGLAASTTRHSRRDR